MLSAPDAEELIDYRRKNPHWSTKIVDQLILLCFVLAKVNGSDTAKMEDFRIVYGKKGNRQSDRQMELMSEALVALYAGVASGQPE